MVAEDVPTKTFQKTLDILHMYGLYKKKIPATAFLQTTRWIMMKVLLAIKKKQD